MKTAFDENLDSFFYGNTCTVEPMLPVSREGKGVISNFPKTVKKLSNVALGVAGAVALTLCLSSVDTAASPGISKTKFRSNHSSSSPIKLDERSKQQLVAKIIKARDFYGFSQEDVADLLNVSPSTVSKLERGEHSPDPRSLQKYNKFLSLSEYLKDKLNNRKFVMRQVFHVPSRLFGDMTAIAFSKTIGEEGLNEVVSLLKRRYG